MTREATAEDLHRRPLLRCLSRATIEALARGATISTLPDRALLFSEGEKAERLHFLCDGIVELFAATTRREAVMSIVWPPELLMPSAVLTDGPFLVSARALGKVETLSLDSGAVRLAAERDAALASGLNRVIAEQFRRLQRNLKDLKLREAPQRVGAFLLRLIDERGEQGFADLPVPKYLLASRLGIAPESFSRALRQLRDHGLVVRGSRAILVDRSASEHFCRPDPPIDGSKPERCATAL